MRSQVQGLKAGRFQARVKLAPPPPHLVTPTVLQLGEVLALMLGPGGWMMWIMPPLFELLAMTLTVNPLVLSLESQYASDDVDGVS